MKNPLKRGLKPQSFFALLVFLLSLFFANMAYSQQGPMSPFDENKEKAAVLETMQNFFSAAATDDLGKFHSAVATDFYAYDGGHRFDGDGLIVLIKKLHASGKVYVWKLTEPEIHVSCNMAWIAYVNRGSITDASGKMDVTWLESAVLEKENGSWHIRFLHSTRVPPPS